MNDRPTFDPALLPNQDIEVTEDFLRDNEVLLAFLSVAVFEGVMESPGVTDWDVRQALDALVATWRTVQSGIYYETRPTNLYAAAITSHVQTVIEEVRQKEAQERGVSSIRDADILGVLAFLQRLEYTRNNGRKRSRAFIDFLGGFYVPPMEAGAENPEENLTEPDEPLIIL